MATLSKARIDKSGIFRLFEQSGYGDYTNGVCIAFVFVFEQSEVGSIPKGVVLYLYLYLYLSRVGNGMGSIPRGVPTVE